jgi:tetratricopeptide (TPR) repeat protein
MSRKGKKNRKSRKRSHPHGKRTVSTAAIPETLTSARESYDKRNFQGCLDKLKPLHAKFGTREPHREREIMLLAARAALACGDYRQLEHWLGRTGSQYADDVEVNYIRFRLHFEMREFEVTSRLGAKVAEHSELTSAGELSFDLPEFYNLLGCAYYECEDFTASEKTMHTAIELKPDFPEAYIWLARARARRGDSDGERAALSDGLIHCTEKNELQLLAEKYLGQERITLCMIVKNEQELLPRCLASVKDAVDEMVIVDTGSDDRTVEIAKSFGAKVYHHPWQNSFSLHRNQSIEYATGDWVMILDADEELERADIAKLRTATRIPDINIISVSVLNKNLKTGELTSFLPSMRLWRRKLNCHYESIVHNELRVPEGEPVLRADIHVYHYGYSLDWDKQKRKIERTRKLLEEQLAAEPNNPFANFNYSQLLRGESKKPDTETCCLILEHSGRTVANTDPDIRTERYLHVSALEQMSAAYFYLQEFDQAEACVQQTLVIDPDYIDGRFDLGHIFAARHEYDRAIEAYEDYIEFANNFKVGDEADSYILQHTNRQPEAYFALGLIYERLEQDQQAIESFERVLEYKDDHLDLHTHLARLYLNSNNLDQARDHAQKRLATSADDSAALFVVAEVARRCGDLDQARALLAELAGDKLNGAAALQSLIKLENECGNQEEADRWRTKLQTMTTPIVDERRRGADELFKAGDYGAASSLLEQLLAEHPADADLLNDLGNCCFKQDQLEEARNYYDRALECNSQYLVAMRNLGLCLYRLEQHEASLEYLERYLESQEEDQQILSLVARILCQLNRDADAIAILEKLLRFRPDSVELITELANCYYRLGHLQSAYLGFRQAIAVDPQCEAARKMLIRLEQSAMGTPVMEDRQP